MENLEMISIHLIDVTKFRLSLSLEKFSIFISSFYPAEIFSLHSRIILVGVGNTSYDS